MNSIQHWMFDVECWMFVFVLSPKRPPAGNQPAATVQTPPQPRRDHMIEHLEARRLLSVTLKDRILKIVGTDAADDVQIIKSREKEFSVNGKVFFVNHLSVTVNGEFGG